MLSRYAVPLLCAAAIAFACGPRQHADIAVASAASTSPAAAPVPAKRASSDTATHIASSLGVAVGAESKITFAVTNRGKKKLELLFPSGQTHEFVALDSTGKEVWRWSEGRMFTQSIQSKLLLTDDTATYTESWPTAGLHGKYTIVATLRSTNHPIETRADVTLP